MKSDSPHHEELHRIDLICDRFENAWRSGPRPNLGAFLDDTLSDQAELFRQLLALDVHYRLSLSESITAEDYTAEFPQFGDAIGEEIQRLPERINQPGVEPDGVVIQEGGGSRSSKVETVEFASDSIEDTDATIELEAKHAQGSSLILRLRCPHCEQSFTWSEAGQDTTSASCPSCKRTFTIAEAERSKTPKSIAHFRLLTRLGAGGFGAVWKAQDTELDRHVAIKIPHQNMIGSTDFDITMREARAAAQLRHPNIVGVHEVGRDGPTVYIVSDFVDGTSMSAWIEDFQPTITEATVLCQTIAKALSYAHKQGIVHRDLKPGNILIDGTGDPHITDFGLAKRETGEITMTLDGQIMGTPAYMSPEQAKGMSHTADARSDLYSVGVMLFELFTGERPFRGNSRMVLKQVIEDEPPSPRKLNNSVSKDLETITLKCLEKEPSRRYQSADELSHDLGNFLADKPIVARPVSQWERTWRWCRRNPLPASLMGIVFCSLAAAAVLGFASAASSRRAVAADLAKQEADARRNLAEQESELEKAQRLMQLGQWVDAERSLGTFLRRCNDANVVPANRLRFAHARSLVATDEVVSAVSILEELNQSTDLSEGMRAAVELSLGDLLLYTNQQRATELIQQAVASGNLTPADGAYGDGLLAKSWDDAIASFSSCLASQPSHFRANQLLIVSLLIRGRYQEAGKQLGNTLVLFPHDARFQALKALVVASDRRHDDAEQAMDQLVNEGHLSATQADVYRELIENSRYFFEQPVDANWSNVEAVKIARTFLLLGGVSLDESESAPTDNEHRLVFVPIQILRNLEAIAGWAQGITEETPPEDLRTYLQTISEDENVDGAWLLSLATMKAANDGYASAVDLYRRALETPSAVNHHGLCFRQLIHSLRWQYEAADDSKRRAEIGAQMADAITQFVQTGHPFNRQLYLPLIDEFVPEVGERPIQELVDAYKRFNPDRSGSVATVATATNTLAFLAIEMGYYAKGIKLLEESHQKGFIRQENFEQWMARARQGLATEYERVTKQEGNELEDATTDKEDADDL